MSSPVRDQHKTRKFPLQALLLIIVAAFWGLAQLTGLRVPYDSSLYVVATSLLLATGLFGSTVGIGLAVARDNLRIILLAITVGVVFKALLIGGVLYLFNVLLDSRNPAFLVLGVAVAQIDPLSVAALLGDDRLSPRVKSILFAWASFDDPVTVLLVVYASTFVFGTVEAGVTGQGGGALAGLSAYSLDLVLNLIFAGVAYLAWRAFRIQSDSKGKSEINDKGGLKGRRTVWLAVVGLLLFAVAVWQFLMLGVAIAGLFFRPTGLADRVAQVTKGALLVAGAVLGLLLVNGVDLRNGLVLGIMAFVSQAAAAGILTIRDQVKIDRVHLALAQQNGITAIILALRLEVQYAKAVAIIAPAILVTNVIHFFANDVLDRRERAKAANASPDEPTPEARTPETEPADAVEAEPAEASDRHNPDGPDPTGHDD